MDFSSFRREIPYINEVGAAGIWVISSVEITQIIARTGQIHYFAQYVGKSGRVRIPSLSRIPVRESWIITDPEATTT